MMTRWLREEEEEWDACCRIRVVQDDGGDVEEGGWDCAGDGDGVSCISCVEVVEVEGGCRGEEAIVVFLGLSQ
jgi:hypothetical protein